MTKITNRKLHTRFRNQWPWKAIMHWHCFKMHASFGAHNENLMKIDPEIHTISSEDVAWSCLHTTAQFNYYCGIARYSS